MQSGSGIDAGRYRIDTHHHIYPPVFTSDNIERLLADARRLSRADYLDWTPQVSLDEMERNGVETAIVSITSPGVWTGHVDDSRRWARECNEYGAGMIRDYPGRFGMFATIPLPDTEGSLREIAYALDTLKLDGIQVLTSYDGKLLGEPSFAPVLAELDRRQAVVFVHPTINLAGRNPNPWLDSPIVEFPFDTTRTITSLLITGTAAKFPNIRWLFCHAGGTFPMLAGRFTFFAQVLPPDKHAAYFPHGVAHEIRKFYYDVVSATNKAAMSALIEVAAMDHLTFGSDAPFTSADEMVEGLRGLGYAAADIRAIERDNALSLLPRLKKARSAAASA